MDLKDQESQIKDRLIELAEKKAEMYRDAFEREKDLTDRALKLAEASKGSSFWQTFATVVGIAAIVAVIAAVF